MGTVTHPAVVAVVVGATVGKSFESAALVDDGRIHSAAASLVPSQRWMHSAG